MIRFPLTRNIVIIYILYIVITSTSFRVAASHNYQLSKCMVHKPIHQNKSKLHRVVDQSGPSIYKDNDVLYILTLTKISRSTYYIN